MIFMTPAMLMPAPEGRCIPANCHKGRPSHGRQPGRDDRQGQWRFMTLKKIDELLEPLSRNADVICTEENAGRTLG
jgi:hypothetical protein